MGTSFDFKSPLARNLAKHNNQDQSFEKTPLKIQYASRTTTVADKTPNTYSTTHTRPTQTHRSTSTVPQTSSSSFAHKLRQRQEQGQPSPATPTSSASPSSSPAQQQLKPTASASTAPPTTSIDDLQHQLQTGLALNGDHDGEEVQSRMATTSSPHHTNLDRRSRSKSPSLLLTTPRNSTFINSAPVKASGPGLLQVIKPTRCTIGGGISKQQLETSVVELLPQGTKATTAAAATATGQQERQHSQKTPPPPEQQQQQQRPSTIQHNLLMSLPPSIALLIDPNIVVIKNIPSIASIKKIEQQHKMDLLQQLHKLKRQGDDLVEEVVSEEFSRVFPPSPLSRGDDKEARMKGNNSGMSSRALENFNRLKFLQSMNECV